MQKHKMVWHTFITINYYLTHKLKIMRSILYILALILIIGWAVGFFGYSVGYLIHILLVMAIISLLIGLIRGDRTA